MSPISRGEEEVKEVVRAPNVISPVYLLKMIEVFAGYLPGTETLRMRMVSKLKALLAR